MYKHLHVHIYSCIRTYGLPDFYVYGMCVYGSIQSIGHKNTNMYIHYIHVERHERSRTYSRRLRAHMYTDRHTINTNQCVEDTTSLWSIAPHREVDANRLREDGLGPALLAVCRTVNNLHCSSKQLTNNRHDKRVSGIHSKAEVMLLRLLSSLPYMLSFQHQPDIHPES